MRQGKGLKLLTHYMYNTPAIGPCFCCFVSAHHSTAQNGQLTCLLAYSQCRLALPETDTFLVETESQKGENLSNIYLHCTLYICSRIDMVELNRVRGVATSSAHRQLINRLSTSSCAPYVIVDRFPCTACDWTIS